MKIVCTTDFVPEELAGALIIVQPNIMCTNNLIKICNLQTSNYVLTSSEEVSWTQVCEGKLLKDQKLNWCDYDNNYRSRRYKNRDYFVYSGQKRKKILNSFITANTEAAKAKHLDRTQNSKLSKEHLIKHNNENYRSQIADGI